MGTHAGHLIAFTAQSAVLQFLINTKLSAFISEQNGACFVYERQSDWHFNEVIKLAKKMAVSLDCYCLGCAVDDDSVLELALSKSHAELLKYNSSPSYYDESARTAPLLIENEGLENFLGSRGTTLTRLREILLYDKSEEFDRAERGEMIHDAVKYVFESERLYALQECLGFSAKAYGIGYRAFQFDKALRTGMIEVKDGVIARG